MSYYPSQNKKGKSIKIDAAIHNCIYAKEYTKPTIVDQPKLTQTRRKIIQNQAPIRNEREMKF